MALEDSATVGWAVLPKRGRRLLKKVPIEAFIWGVGLTAMAAMDPGAEHLFSLCPLDAMGLSSCPGCGLGHAIAYLARGAVAQSVAAHPLGIPVVLLLVVHSGRLLLEAWFRETYIHS